MKIEINIKKAKECIIKNNFKDAIKYYSLAISQKKDFADAYYGRALCMRYYDKKKAYEDFKAAFRYNRRYGERARYYYGFINFYIEQNELEKALKITEKFGRSYSATIPWEKTEYLMRKAITLALMKKYDDALKVLQDYRNLTDVMACELSGSTILDTDFFYSNYELLLGNIYLITGKEYLAYSIFLATAKVLEDFEAKNGINKYNSYILIPLYLFLDKKEKAMERIRYAISKQENKGYFYSWFASYTAKYCDNKTTEKLILEMLKNGYINEGILKSDILQGYFLKDIITNSKLFESYKFE
ncbi:MAG: hypothetical protein N2446_01260 [Elusimicrobiales bacterium]|nr:hypothetical protein [Elusimicrobiales bacterium]